MKLKSIAAATAVSAGLLVGGVTLATAPAQAAQTACTTSAFRVTWEAAGVYSAAIRDTAYLVKTKHSGDRVTGPTGGTGENWTKVYYNGGAIGFMPKDSVVYVGCS